MPLTIGVVGAGSAALRAHLPALCRAEEAGVARVVAIADPSPDRRDRVQARCPGAVGVADADALLDAVTPDLLVIASPPSSHLSAVRAAFTAGVDVLCEKPLGLSMRDADALAGLCAAHPQVLLASVHQYRLAPAWTVLSSMARAALHDEETVRIRLEVERPGTDPLSAGGWRAKGTAEGGILGDHAVHHLALAWSVDSDVRVLSAAAQGSLGRQTATVRLGIGPEAAAADARRTSTVDIVVSSAGRERRNLAEISVSGRGTVARWLDGELTVGEHSEPTPSLSDRQAVDDLYGLLYDEILASVALPEWRAGRTAETLGVSALLGQSLDLCR